jgi:hypothetical protein
MDNRRKWMLVAALALVAFIASAALSARTNSPQRCDQCGVIVAIVPSVLDTGSPYVSDGYFVYDLFIRMEKTGLLRRVKTGTQGALFEGQRVKVWGGTVEPVS